MRAFDRDLIRGGHYGQRSCEPHIKAEHMAAPTKPAYVKKALANSEPSTHDPLWSSEPSLRQSAAYIPRATSAQCNTVLLFRNSMTPGSIVAGRSWGSTAVATIMSQRSLKATDIADLPSGLRAGSV